MRQKETESAQSAAVIHPVMTNRRVTSALEVFILKQYTRYLANSRFTYLLTPLAVTRDLSFPRTTQSLGLLTTPGIHPLHFILVSL